MDGYEENHEWSTLKSWGFIILLSAFLLTLAMSMMILIKEVPRKWEFGNMAFTPGKSVYSTSGVNKKDTTSQIEALPEAISIEEFKKNKHKKNITREN